MALSLAQSLIYFTLCLPTGWEINPDKFHPILFIVKGYIKSHPFALYSKELKDGAKSKMPNSHGYIC